MGFRSIKTLLFLATIVIFVCCTSVAQRRVEAEYPKCKVTEQDSSRSTIIIKITCPNKEPFTKTFHRKQ